MVKSESHLYRKYCGVLYQSRERYSMVTDFYQCLLWTHIVTINKHTDTPALYVLPFFIFYSSWNQWWKIHDSRQWNECKM